MDDLVERIDLRFDHVDERFDRVEGEIRAVRTDLRQETKDLRQAITNQGVELNLRFDALQRTLLGGFLGMIGTLLGAIAAILVAHFA